MAIRSGALGDSTLVARKIAEATRVICASPRYLKQHGSPLVPADLLQHNCLTLPGFAWSQWPFHTHEGINRLAVSGTFTSDNADLLLDMAMAGLTRDWRISWSRGRSGRARSFRCYRTAT